MKRDMRLYVYDILESILAIEEYTKDISEESFYESRQVQDAVIRRFEIIGEAVKNLDTDFRNKYSDVPWIKIAAIRNVFIHILIYVKTLLPVGVFHQRK